MKTMIKVTIEVEFEPQREAPFDTALNAEEAIGDHLHAWLQDYVELTSFSVDAEQSNG